MSTQVAITNPGIGGLGESFSGEGSGADFLGALISVVVSILLIVGGLYFFIQLLTGAVAWIGSGGDKAELENARGKIFSAGIGLILLFSAWAVITLIENVFNIPILSPIIPTLT